jgi:hypothetical protein
MRTFRRILSVYFLAAAALCTAETLVEIRNLLLHRDPPGFTLAVAASLISVALLATAGWVLWQEQASKKRWVTAASLLNLAVALGPLALYLGLRVGGIRLQPGAFSRPLCLGLIPMAFGIAGLFAFPREQPPANPKAER